MVKTAVADAETGIHGMALPHLRARVWPASSRLTRGQAILADRIPGCADKTVGLVIVAASG